MTVIGFIGLGAMGVPIAHNLMSRGASLRIYNRTPEKVSDFLNAIHDGEIRSRVADVNTPGGTLDTPGGVVFSVVANDAALEAICSGQGGVLSTIGEGGVHVCLSTVSPVIADRMAEAHAACGAAYISCPVFGRPEAAAGAKLICVPAGPHAAVDRVLPYLSHISPKIVRAGEKPSSANILKLCGNFSILAVIEASAEAYALAEGSGIDRSVAYDLISGPGGLMSSLPIHINYGRMVAQHAYKPVGFTAANGLKDATLIANAAAAAGVDMPLVEIVKRRLEATVSEPGGGDRDWASIASQVKPAGK